MFAWQPQIQRAQVSLLTPLEEGTEMPGTICQQSWSYVLPTAGPCSWRMQNRGRLVRIYTWCCTLGLAKPDVISQGKLPATDPTARWDLLFRIIPHLAASAAEAAAFFPLVAIPLGLASCELLSNFSEVLEACVFAAVNPILFGEVLLVPFPPPFLCCFFSCCLWFFPFLSSYRTSVSAQSSVSLEL